MAGPTISVEGPRGCGYRKEGGLYVVGGTIGTPCARLPIPLHACPTCGGGWRFSRGWKWIEPKALLVGLPACEMGGSALCGECPLGGAIPERAGMLWVGESHYPTPQSFAREARERGVSKRLAHMPKDVVPGETVVYLAHPRAIVAPCAAYEAEAEAWRPSHAERCETCEEGKSYGPGLFTAFVVARFEQIVAETASDAECERLRARGIEPVAVRPVPEHPGATTAAEAPALH